MNFTRLLPISFFQWFEDTFIANYIHHSKWAFAIAETIHIIGLSILLGSTFLVDLRLLGHGLKRQSVTEISKNLNRWTWAMFGIILLTGIFMFDSEAVRMGKSGPFFFKMMFLLLAIVLHLTIHRKVTAANAPEGTAMAKVAAYLSLVCWLCVALAGRAIAFFA